MTKEQAIMHVLEKTLGAWEFELETAKRNMQIIKETKDMKVVGVLRGVVAKAQRIMDDDRFE